MAASVADRSRLLPRHPWPRFGVGSGEDSAAAEEEASAVDVVAALEVAEEVVDSVVGAREASNRRVAVTVDTETVRGKS